MKNFRIIASPTTWIEGEAVRQLETTAAWPSMRLCVGMPDLHPGKGTPVGAAFASDLIFPGLVGSDIGCGMALFTTDLRASKAKVPKIVTALDGLDSPWDGDTTVWLTDRGIDATIYDASLGTPGHGNHFIELQQIVDIINPDRFALLGLSKDHLCLTIHSGSRGFGEAILYNYTAQNGAKGIAAESTEGQAYLAQNRHAMAWAVANRDLCAHRTLEAIRADGQRVLDICHNSVTAASLDGCQCWLHRKGAAPADQGVVIIPGSRGDLSYIVQPIERDDALWSLAHGAGRKIGRGDAHGKLETLYRNKDLRQNRWGGQVVCGERSLLWEEAPECYKDIATVITDLVEARLISIIATVRPLATFKTSEGAKEEVRRDRKTWQRERHQARDLKRR